MKLEELKKKFIVDEDVLKSRLEPLVELALEHCVLDKEGRVHISNSELPGRDKVMLVLAARMIASQLDPKIPAETALEDLVRSTGLPVNQVRARAFDLTKHKMAEPVGKGIWRALPHRLELFLTEINPTK